MKALVERQRWRDANRTRHRKSDTMRDLIVQWDTNLFATNTGLLHKVHDTFHERLTAEMVTIEPREPSLAEQLHPDRFGTLRFMRKVRSRYDPAQKWWEPLSEEICISEPTLVMVAGGEQVLGAVEDGSLVNRIRRTVPDYRQTQCLLLIIGLDAHLRHLRNQANRAFVAGVRQHIQGQGTTVTIPHYQASENVERALLQLQLQHRCHVIRVVTVDEAVEWLYAIASDISFRPYKCVIQLTQAPAVCSLGAPLDQDVDGPERNLSSYAGGNCKCSILTQPRCTPHVSSAIVYRYPTLRSLLDAFDACPTEEASQLLAPLVCDGRTQRSLGPQLSRRMCKKLTAGIYTVFSSQDAKGSME